MEYFSDSSCTKSLGYALDYFLSVCNVITIAASNGDTYYSYQRRMPQDLSGVTLVMFKNSDCEGTPTVQANTNDIPLEFPTNECSFARHTNDIMVYIRPTLQRYAVGNPFDTYAVKYVEHTQTDTCDSKGLETNVYFRSGTCMNMTSTEDASYKYVPLQGAFNATKLEYYPCADCACGLRESSVVRDNVCCRNIIINYSFVERDNVCVIQNDDQDDDGQNDTIVDDQDDMIYENYFDDLQVETMSGYKDETFSYYSYALPQTCLWSTGCSNSPGGKMCEVGTYCKEYQWWSQCLENTVNNSQPQVFNPDKKCISTRNGHGPNAHWGCEYNADCCNPQAVCNAYSRTCNLPCEAMTEPESLSISNDAVLSGSSLVVLVPVVAGVGLFTVLASLSLYYYGFICRRGADTKSREFESQSEMTVIVDSGTAVHVLE